MTANDDELAYYRAIEDHFARNRGVPHILSSKDFQLMRRWWRETVPLRAVLLAITEVTARRLQEGDEDPVVSLAYCRHAVKRHARRLREMHAGEPEDPSDREVADAGSGEAIHRLLVELCQAAQRHEHGLPAVASVLAETARAIERIAPELATAELEAHLFDLETTLLEGCWRALDEKDREAVLARAHTTSDTTAAPVREDASAQRALRDRELRAFLHLPRLELT